MINNNLYQAGIIAIPIKDDNFISDFKPNFLVLNSQQGWFPNQSFENPILNEIEKKTCVQVQLLFVKRTLWSDGQLNELRIPSRKPFEFLPVETLNLATGYDVLLYAKDNVNAILSLFDFEGGHLLEGFNPVLDEEKCNEIIEDIGNRENIQNILSQNFSTKQEIEDYITSEELDINILLEYPNFELYYNNKS